MDISHICLFVLSKFLEANGSNAVSAGMPGRYKPSGRPGSLPVINCGKPDGKATATSTTTYLPSRIDVIR